MPDPMTASDLAVQLVAKLATTAQHLDEHIERRAQEIAVERSARCTRIAHRAAEEADRQNRRIAALEAELTAVRAAKTVQVPPLFLRACDPVVWLRDDEVIVSCGRGNGSAEGRPVIMSMVVGSIWSALVAAVAAHRCGEGSA